MDQIEYYHKKNSKKELENEDTSSTVNFIKSYDKSNETLV